MINKTFWGLELNSGGKKSFRENRSVTASNTKQGKQQILKYSSKMLPLLLSGKEHSTGNWIQIYLEAQELTCLRRHNSGREGRWTEKIQQTFHREFLESHTTPASSEVGL